MPGVDAVAVYLFVIKQMIAGLAFAIFISGLDDLFIDLCYLINTGWRRVKIYTRFSRATAAQLTARDERPFAIMIPAWREADVIGAMLQSTLERLDYRNYQLFVGVYPNDPHTRAIVDRFAKADPRVIRADVPHPGGTSKGDCLNAIWRRIRLLELETGIVFAGFVLHDAEDMVPARELTVFNHLIGRKDMVQLPVLPLPQLASPWVAGHYMDEFAELHGKDMLVREWMGVTVPCAGVACAFSRRAMVAAARENAGQLFAATSLTEDYELAHRLHRMGFSSVFVRINDSPRRAEVLATAEYFPDAFEAAVRQKARWLAGITLQGWDQIGWRGSLAERYMLLRDRKALSTAWVNMLAYLAGLHMLALGINAAWFPHAPQFDSLVTPGSATQTLLQANAGLLLWRLGMRASFVNRLYGPGEAILSLPRSVVGNVINFVAATRAIKLYFIARLTSQPPRWDKTAHHFPAAHWARLP